MIEQLAYQGYPLVSKYYEGVVGLARKLAFKYGKASLEEDFSQIALATACRMERTYSKEFGASFYTYVNKPIKSEIQKAFGNPNRQTKTYKMIQEFINVYDKQHGLYPDVYTISKGTGLSRFEILSVYYDKYREVPLDTSLDHADMSDPFKNDDHSWITDHLDILDDEERYLISSLYTHELPMKYAADALELTVREATDLRDQALAKLKRSVEQYQ